jgi:cystathionine gamma-synthase
LGADKQFNAVVAPIYLSTTYGFNGLEGRGQFDYSRSGNPTRQQLINALVGLEGGAGGDATSTGMGAAGALAHRVLRQGDLVFAPHDCYGGTWRLFTALADSGFIEVAFIDLSAADAQALIAARHPKLVWVETPSNPLLRITDIAAVTEAAHAVNAVVAVDNTFMSPILQRPLDFGVDYVVYSTTKYISGHSDVVGGAIIAATVEDAEQVHWWCNTLGVTASPFDSYLTMRGLRTMAARMALHNSNAEKLVAAVSGHPAIKALYWPGLVSHPGHELAAKQQRSFGAMLSIDVGSFAAATTLCAALKLFTLAESLGGVESLICSPATMTHAAMPAAVQAAAGITPGLLRLSIGIEDSADLIADLGAGLDQVVACGNRAACLG